GGTMCPSYRATREEAHSTRGRAHLLFEMLQGDPLDGGWKDEHVKDALDLCLACKGCKSECPVNVDLATYKAEFLSHYYAGRLRPASAYSMGLIHWWARAAAVAPGAVNFLTRARPFHGLLAALGGIAPERAFPAFAPETFRAWFARRAARRSRPAADGPRGVPHGEPRPRREVLLWPDTFHDHFHPETAQAAV